MKTALSLITVPFALSFLSGVFSWDVDEGMFILFGFSMLIGIIWAWKIEMSR